MNNQLLAKLKKRQEANGIVDDAPKITPEKKSMTTAVKGNSQFEENKNRLKAFFEQKMGGGGGTTKDS